MKILHVVWGLQYGGAETMLVDIINYQAKNHQVMLLIINNAIDKSLLKDINANIEIIKNARPLGSKNPFYVIRFNLAILRSKADIVHFHQDDIIRYVPWHKKNNFCLTVHSVKMDVVSLPKYKNLFAISPTVKDKLKQDYGLDSILVDNGISIKKIVCKTSNDTQAEVLKIVQVGRLDHEPKGQDVLIRALAILLTEYNFSSFILYLIGEGKSREYLQKIVAQLKLEKHVVFLGKQTKKEIQDNLHKYDLLVQPSMWEGFGLAVAEAMVAKVPCLISNIDGLKTLAQDNKNAMSFESGNSNDCAKMIFEFVDLSVEEKETMTERAYQYVSENFDVSKTSQAYLSNYEAVVKLI